MFGVGSTVVNGVGKLPEHWTSHSYPGVKSQHTAVQPSAVAVTLARACSPCRAPFFASLGLAGGSRAAVHLPLATVRSCRDFLTIHGHRAHETRKAKGEEFGVLHL